MCPVRDLSWRWVEWENLPIVVQMLELYRCKRQDRWVYEDLSVAPCAPTDVFTVIVDKDEYAYGE